MIFLSAQMIPTHDRELIGYMIAAVVLLVVGGALIAIANRRKR